MPTLLTQQLRCRQTPRQPQASRPGRSRAAASVRGSGRDGSARGTRRGLARGLNRPAACPALDADARAKRLGSGPHPAPDTHTRQRNRPGPEDDHLPGTDPSRPLREFATF